MTNNTFEILKNMFAECGKDYLRVGVSDDTRNYVNLSLILSDQCKHTIKIAVFEDDENTILKNRVEFGGSVFNQLDAASHYLSFCNKTTTTFNGLEKIERKDYPDGVIYEALLNAIVHRDYSFSGSIIINVNNKEMEFISLGGLISKFSIEDIELGISQPRNENLAKVFEKLYMMASCGTGIRKIYTLYKDYKRIPEIISTLNTFKIILPNVNARR